MSNRIRFGILHLRGGLGNQLFQLSALAQFSRELGFKPIIYDKDLFLSERDDFFPQYRKLDTSSWFSTELSPKTLPKYVSRIVQIFMKFVPSNIILKEQDLLSANNSRDLPRFFFIRGTFEDQRYIDDSLKSALKATFEALSIGEQSNTSPKNVALHIRVAGYPAITSAQLQNIKNLILKLNLADSKEIDLYSDDLPKALTMLGEIPEITIRCPEKHHKLEPQKLLFALSCYQLLICNGSSLARWATYLGSISHEHRLVDFTKLEY